MAKQRSQRSVQAENQLRDSLICMLLSTSTPPHAVQTIPRPYPPYILMRPAVSVRASGRHSRHHVVASVTVEIILANGATVVENGITNPQGMPTLLEYCIVNVEEI